MLRVSADRSAVNFMGFSWYDKAFFVTLCFHYLVSVFGFCLSECNESWNCSNVVYFDRDF